MLCTCDSEAKEFRCIGVGSVHEIRVYKGKELTNIYICTEDINVVIVDGKVIVIRSQKRDSGKEHRWVDVHI